MTELREVVQELVAQTGIPGAVVGVFEDGKIEAVGAGIANLNSGVEMTPETLFLTGSITKVWTTTLLMSFVEQGLIDLDAPVKRYLPDLELGEPGAADALIVRHLVTHASGIDAQNLIADVGDGDEAIANYIELLRTKGQLYEPGEYFSYCNTGFVIAGRIMEVVTGEGWSTLMRERLFAPLGLERSMFTANEAILHRMAIGHSPGANGYEPTKLFMMPACIAPAGTTLITSVHDTLRLMQIHMPTVASDPPFLGEETVARMASHVIDYPVPGAGSCGLSWLRKQHGDRIVLTHGGGSYGGVAMVGVVPDMGAAYIAFANGGGGSMGFHTQLAKAILEERFGLPPREEPDRSGPALPQSRYPGRYVCWGAEITITEDGDGLAVQSRITDEVLARGRPESPVVRVRPAGSEALVLADYPDLPPFGYCVGDDGEGHPQFLFLFDQFARRVADA
jgi:CubicO group peptidase (beta-lactamase class C family)